MDKWEYPLILDGGLATELERSFGKDLSGKLWSAQCLQDDPDAIKAVHRAYFEAGANVATTASYQASVRGFLEAGYTREQAQDLMRKSVRLAREARDEFGKGLVALSMGCYGAVLANGAEYTGEYGSVITIPDLVRFHRERLDILLQEPGIDFILFETVPSFMEAQAIRQLVLEDTKLPPVGVSFSCRSEEHVSDGTLLSECISVFNNVPGVFAVGVNCTKPKYIPALVRVLADSNNRNNNEKAILLYPDGGEEWDPVARSWNFEQKVPIDVFGTSMAEWDKVAGTRMILGGCCGTGPRHIASIRNHLVQS